MINSIMLERCSNAEKFTLRAFPLRFTKSIRDIGSLTPYKLYILMKLICRLAGKLLWRRPKLAYFTIVPTGNAFYRDLLFVFTLKFFRVPILYHLHGKGIAAVIAKKPKIVSLYRYVFAGTQVICGSRSLGKDIQEVYQGEPYYVPNGIPDLAPLPGKSNNSVPSILFLSSLSKNKGLLVFLEAVRALVAQGRSFMAYIAGSEQDISRAMLKEFLDSSGLTGFVTVLGKLSEDEKIDQLARTDVFVLPTLNDTFPLVVLEAMRQGVPVVATPEGAIAEMVDDSVTGLLARRDDAPDLADKLAVLLKNPRMREEMGHNGRKKFEREYSLEIFSANMTAVFEQAIRIQAV